jgi:hypothetical protein
VTGHSLATALISFDARWINDVDTAIAAWDARGTVKTRLDDTQVVHFASVTTVKIADDSAVIVIELTADVPGQDALRLFAGLLAPEIFALLTAAGIDHPDRLEPWLLARSIRIGQLPFITCGLLFDGVPDMTVRRIKAEEAIVIEIESNLPWMGGAGSADQKLTAIRNNLWPKGAFKPGFVPQPAPILNPAPPDKTISDKLRINAVLAWHFLIWPLPALPLLILAFALLPCHGGWLAHFAWAFLDSIIVLALATGALTARIRWLETHDIVSDKIQTKSEAERILERENVDSQNILATVSVLKPGLARRLTLQLVFYFIRTVLPLYWAPGRLGDLNDIHFMRWFLLPGTNLLVFRSHYDGAWVNYIEDFALRAPQGVSAIWSNTEHFPPTQWLTHGGAATAPRFRQWVHTQTKPVFFNYSAYPNLSMERIRLHARIAHAIATGILDDGVKGWLVSLGDASGGDF